MSNENFLLLGTGGCHLCESAELIILNLAPQINAKVETIDIAEQEQWQGEYASLIPVLLHKPSNRKLIWPFNESQALNFFKTTKYD